MRPNRLSLLICLLLLLAGARIFYPPASEDAPAVASALPVPREPRSRRQEPTKPMMLEHSQDEDGDADMPGNAFPVRPVPVAPQPQPLSAAARAATVVPIAPAPPPVVLPPPLQVVGTFDDGTTPAVFVATSGGTMLARLGTVLLADYKVTAISTQQLTVLQLSTQRTSSLPILSRSAP